MNPEKTNTNFLTATLELMTGEVLEITSTGYFTDEEIQKLKTWVLHEFNRESFGEPLTKEREIEKADLAIVDAFGFKLIEHYQSEISKFEIRDASGNLRRHSGWYLAHFYFQQKNYDEYFKAEANGEFADDNYFYTDREE
jgi:hypothetical protein